MLAWLMVLLKGVADVSGLSLYEVLKESVDFRPQSPAYSYLGVSVSFTEFLAQVDHISLCYRKIGVSEGDRVVICLPNCPQALISFYALNKLGAISVMIHPLSSAPEIERYINDSDSKVAITIGKLVGNFPRITSESVLRTLIVASPVDPLPAIKRGLAKLMKEDVRIPRLEKGSGMITWKEFSSADVSFVDRGFPKVLPDDPACILYTGGTTGVNKGAVHSNKSFNTSAMGMVQASNLQETDGMKMLANLPMFHGFGLCTCFHIPVFMAVESVLMPIFSVDLICKAITKDRINYIAGVPNLFEKIVDSGLLEDADMSCIAGVFCGGDYITTESKRRFDEFLKARGSNTFMRVGYGSTEVLAAISLTDRYVERTGSCGLALPGFYTKIVKQGTEEKALNGEYGEICVSGPSLMQGYLNNEEETSKVLRKHDDGKTWFHTGDIGYMDDDGHLYFISRMKRVIVTSGYNVYPSQIENILNSIKQVKESCVIGVPDKDRGEKVVAFVVLKDCMQATEKLRKAIADYVEENIVLYARPREYRFVQSMPKTKLFKIDYKQLENDY